MSGNRQNRQNLVSVQVNTERLLRYADQVSNFHHIIEEEFGKAVRRLAMMTELRAKENCPVDTGKLRASIVTQIQSLAVAWIGTNTEYAAHVEYGTEPHEIRPRIKKALAFNGYVVGKVNHPGTEAQPFLEPAYLWADRNANRIFNNAMKRAIKRLERACQ